MGVSPSSSSEEETEDGALAVARHQRQHEIDGLLDGHKIAVHCEEAGLRVGDNQQLQKVHAIVEQGLQTSLDQK